jgi:hypothetical protein
VPKIATAGGWLIWFVFALEFAFILVVARQRQRSALTGLMP